MDRLIRQAEGVVQIAVEASGTDVAAGLAGLAGVRGVEPTRAGGDGRVALRLTADKDADVRPGIFELAKTRGWTLYELHQEAASLEELFRQLTAGPERP